MAREQFWTYRFLLLDLVRPREALDRYMVALFVMLEVIVQEILMSTVIGGSSGADKNGYDVVV